MKNYQTIVIILLVFVVVALVFGVYSLLEASTRGQVITYGKGYAAAEEVFSNWQDEPLPPSFKTPENAVLSYLLWTSWGYYIGDMELALDAMTSFAEPRLSAYIAKLIQDDLRINQRLDRLEVISVDIESYNNEEKPGYDTYIQTAIVRTNEFWTFNYQTISTGEWDAPTQATYEMTYTLYKDPLLGWFVDDLDMIEHEGVR
jgi:hypothetical protein